MRSGVVGSSSDVWGGGSGGVPGTRARARQAGQRISDPADLAGTRNRRKQAGQSNATVGVLTAALRVQAGAVNARRFSNRVRRWASNPSVAVSASASRRLAFSAVTMASASR